MKTVKASFNVGFDYSETVQEMINDGEFDMNEGELRDYIISLVMEDLHDLSIHYGDVKNQTYIEIHEESNDEENQ